jgi:putative oxidoreductase
MNMLSWWMRLYPVRGSTWWPLPLRVIVGYGFMEHGWAKLARGPENFTDILAALHMPFPGLLAWATILTELIGGFAVLVGALVPVVSLPMIVVLAVAIFTVHPSNGFSSIKLQSVDAQGAHFGQPGYETDLLYLAGIIALVLGGGGMASVDGVLLRRKAVEVVNHKRSAGPGGNEGCVE